MRRASRGHSVPRLSLAVLLLFVVAACAPAAPSAPAAPAKSDSAAKSAAPAAPAPASQASTKEAAPAPAPATAGQPQKGGTFVFAVPGNFANCNAFDVNDRPTNMTLDHVFETLVRYDYNKKDYRANMDVVPWLAEKWEKPDPTTYVFTLRQATWHDGKPLIADDVVATYDLLKAKNYAAMSNWRIFKSVEKVDARTVKFVVNEPSTDWLVLSNLAEPSVAQIRPKHVIDAGTLETDCTGTGAFKIQNIAANSRASMVRYENYWRKDEAGQQQPYLEKLEMIYGMDRSAMQGAFAAGELDMIPLTTWPEVESFTRQVQGAQVYSYPAHWSHGLVINFGKEPFNDKRVRQAVDMLIDRAALIDTVMFGKGVLSLPVVPAVREGTGYTEQQILQLPGYREDKTADIAEAKKLLADAGYGPGGKKLTFELLYTRTWAIAPAIEFLATQLKQHDIEVVLRGVDSATFSRDKREGKFDAALWHLASPDPFLRPLGNWYTQSADAKGAGMPDLGQDKLFEDLRATTDVAKQRELLAQLQKLAVDEVFGFTLADPVFFAVTQPWVNNYRPSLSVQPEVTGSANQLWLDPAKLPAKRK